MRVQVEPGERDRARVDRSDAGREGMLSAQCHFTSTNKLIGAFLQSRDALIALSRGLAFQYSQIPKASTE